MEASTQKDITKRLVASSVISRAESLQKSICETIKVPKIYSWMWDGKATKVPSTLLKEKYYPLAVTELRKPSMRGRIYFNECSMGKRFPTKFKLINSEKLCFY